VDDDTFLTQFEACTLPFEQWAYRVHPLEDVPR